MEMTAIPLFPYENTETKSIMLVLFVLFRVLQYLVVLSVAFLSHCTPSSTLTLRLPECFKDIREPKDRDVFFCFSQLMTVL